MNEHLIKHAKKLGINLNKLINKVCKVTVKCIQDNERYTFIGLVLDTETPYFVNFSHPVENDKCTCGEIGLSVYSDVQYSVYQLETVDHITKEEYNHWLKHAVDMDLNILKNGEKLLCYINYPETSKY